MFGRLWTKASVGLLAALMLLGTVLVAPVSAAELQGSFLGAAWGNSANAKAGNLSTRLGRAAYQPCPCDGTNGNIRSTTVQDVNAGDVYRAGELRSTAQADKTADARAFAQTTSRVANLSALDGLIRADAIYAVATVRATASTISVSPAGSAITRLRIAGQTVTVDPGERINIPGFGYAVFFDVRRSGDGETRRAIQVEMMRIVITKNNSLDLPVGAVIRVAHALVGFSRLETDTVVGAAAWGSDATSTALSVVNKFGRSAPVYLGCFTTATSAGSNRVDSVSYPGLFHSGEIVNSVTGAVSSTVASAGAVSRLQTVNLLDGLVTADVIRGAAAVTVDGTGGSTSFEGSRFVNLRVLGQAIGDDVAPNTKIELPDIGELTLFETVASSDGNEAHAAVYMVVLRVNVLNSLGLPIGTTIRLARAKADASQP